MSRFVEASEGYQTIVEEIASMDECKLMINDVCCNDLSDQCWNIVDSEYCKTKCKRFVKEDGIIED